MRILLFHNRYQLPGGEDVVLEQELNLLRQNGHTVELATISNECLSVENVWQGLRLGLQTAWSINGYHLAQSAIQKFKPDVIHVHIFFPLLSMTPLQILGSAGSLKNFSHFDGDFLRFHR